MTPTLPRNHISWQPSERKSEQIKTTRCNRVPIIRDGLTEGNRVVAVACVGWIALSIPQFFCKLQYRLINSVIGNSIKI